MFIPIPDFWQGTASARTHRVFHALTLVVFFAIVPMLHALSLPWTVRKVGLLLGGHLFGRGPLTGVHGFGQLDGRNLNVQRLQGHPDDFAAVHGIDAQIPQRASVARIMPIQLRHQVRDGAT
ncbi:MAG: hypothetical protein AB7E72_17210 [Lysobacterales bacterium]